MSCAENGGDAVTLPAFRPQIDKFHDYSIGRPSQIWSDAAKLSKRQQNILRLSRPRPLHPEYKPPKPAIPVITTAAKKFVPSERIEELAKAIPRILRKEGEWGVKPAALTCSPSERIQELSRPRCLPIGYLPDKSNKEIWKVSPGARKAVISDRIEELSKPIIRTVATNLPRDDAFIVSMAARQANASDRIIELSQPIKRDF